MTKRHAYAEMTFTHTDGGEHQLNREDLRRWEFSPRTAPDSSPSPPRRAWETGILVNRNNYAAIRRGRKYAISISSGVRTGAAGCGCGPF